MTLKKPNRCDSDKRILQVFSSNLRKVRKKAGYTQESFAHAVGFSRSYYTEIETGKRNISYLNIIKIIRKLNISIVDLFDTSESSNGDT